MKESTFLILVFFLIPFLFTVCEKMENPVLGPNSDNQNITGKKITGTQNIPSPLVTYDNLEFWPYTGNDFSGTPSDPINVILTGNADPRMVRAALMFLDGDRTAWGFPAEFPFNVTWQDAIGGIQTTYSSNSSWVGSPIQMEGGDYQQMRFHIRFFDMGEATLVGSHLEFLIPNTTEHQVISWEIPEQLLVVDLLRSGLVDPVSYPPPTILINDYPWFREIPAMIWAGMPPELQFLVGSSPDPTTGNVPLPSDGYATVLHLNGNVNGIPQIATQEFTIDFDAVIPKPICASSPYDLIYVQGPVTLRQKVIYTPSGNFISQFHAQGRLDLTPVDVSYQPIGNTYQAIVNEHYRGIVTHQVNMASSFQMQIEVPPSGPFRGQLLVHLNVGPGNSSQYSLEVKCEP